MTERSEAFDRVAIAAARDRFFAPVNQRPVLMGIVNVTPDSFSDGGLFASKESALAQARKLVAEGADIVDVGAESTRPGHTPVSPEEEWARLEPLLATLVAKAGAPVSIDTYKASTARRALAVGVAVVNDVWGLQRDPDMVRAVAESDAGVVIMHNRDNVDPDIDILADMLRFFERSLDIARRAEVSMAHIALDPGVGFGKSREQNYAALRAIPQLLSLGFPLLIGVSRKSIFKDLSCGVVEGRLLGTLAANLACAGKGAQIFRVHDVADHCGAFAVQAALSGAERPHGVDANMGSSMGSNMGSNMGSQECG
jgi:dihydropteroate synthase